MKYMAAVFLASSAIATASAQSQHPAIASYYQCFDSSAQSQFKGNPAADPNLVAELAFQACSTEEQVILTRLSLATVPNNQAWAILLKHRIHLKRKITG